MKGRRTRTTLVIGVVVLLALALVSWFVILSPRLSQAARVQADANQLAGANLALHNQYNREVALAKEAPAAAQEAQALFAKMPQQAELPTVLDQITKAATDAGIPLENTPIISASLPQAVVPGKATQTGAPAVESGVQLATMQIDISASGTPEQILTFIDNLQALDRALLITSTQITNNLPSEETGKKKPDQTAQIGGLLFILESKLPDLVASVTTLIPPEVQAGASPGASPSPVASPGSSATTPTAGATAAASPAPSAAPVTSSTPLPLKP